MRFILCFVETPQIEGRCLRKTFRIGVRLKCFTPEAARQPRVVSSLAVSVRLTALDRRPTLVTFELDSPRPPTRPKNRPLKTFADTVRAVSVPFPRPRRA